MVACPCLGTHRPLLRGSEAPRSACDRGVWPGLMTEGCLRVAGAAVTKVQTRLPGEQDPTWAHTGLVPRDGRLSPEVSHCGPVPALLWLSPVRTES